MIPNFITQLSNAGLESGHAHHRGPELDPDHIGAVTQRHAENAYWFTSANQSLATQIEIESPATAGL
jgi:hypothetical protein